MIEVKIKQSEMKLDIYAHTEKKLKEFVKGASQDITDNLVNSRVVSDSGSYAQPAPLSNKYKEFKQKNYGYSNVFWGKTKKLLKSVKFKKIGTLHYKIYIAGERSDVAEYVNDGTNKMPSRRFFGISEDVIKKFQDSFGKERINA